MNILIFSWRGPGHPNAGGAEIVTLEHAKYWVKSGNIVTLFTSYFKGCKSRETVDGISVIRVGEEAIGVKVLAFFWYFFGNHHKFDLVIDEFHGLPFFTPLYVKTKKIAFIHEVTKEVWGLNPWPAPFNLIPKFLGVAFESWIFKLIYKNIRFITVSDSTKQDLINWNVPEVNINVINNGIKIRKMNKIFKKEAINTAIFLGALTEDKGIKQAIKVFYKINQIDNNWQYWIIGKGSGNYLNTLKKEVEKLGLKNKIRFWGFVSEDKKFELLSRGHIVINPSIREGWGLVVIEAAAMGTPTIGFNVPGLKDSIVNNKTGVLCQKGDLDKMAEEVVNLINNPQRYQNMKKAAVEWSRKFDWNKSSKESLDLVKNVVDNPSSS